MLSKMTTLPYPIGVVDDTLVRTCLATRQKALTERQWSAETVRSILTAMALGEDDEADFLSMTAGEPPAVASQSLNNLKMTKKKDAARERLRAKLEKKRLTH